MRQSEFYSDNHYNHRDRYRHVLTIEPDTDSDTY